MSVTSRRRERAGGGFFASAAWLAVFWAASVAGLGGSVAIGQQGLEPDLPDDATATAPRAARQPGRPPRPLESYKGRQIAQTMHFLGAEWLVRDTREREERCSLMLANLGVKRGMTVCDMGSGNGFYTLPMAKMVGAEGHVYAVDIQPEMLKMLNDRADKEGISNITPVLGAPHHPRLPKGKVDLILCVDVYHEFSYPEQMLQAMREALSPEGAVVLVEYRGEDPNVPIKPEHKMTKAQIMKELVPNGFRLSHEFEKLPWQHMMWFKKSPPDEPASP